MSKNPQTSEPTDVTPSKKFKDGEEATKFKLTYFNLKWLAEPIRLILSYLEEDFEDNRIDQAGWEKVKNGMLNINTWNLIEL